MEREREIFPSNFVKVVTDHDIKYGSNDCLIQCLNEITNKRLLPLDIRKKIWPKGRLDKDLHTNRHITEIAKMYDIRLVLSDVINQKKIIFNRNNSNNIHLVKCGKVIGIFDRIDYTTDKRNISNNIVFFDLETVGPDQRVYAYTWRCKDGDMTICHNDFDFIEGELVNKVVDTIHTAGDNETIIAYAWNGSRFDNWIMFNLLKKHYKKKLWVHDIVINSGNELLMFKLTINRDNGSKVTMIFKDPKKMFSVSIPEACKVFNINEGKHEFNHDDVDKHYLNGTFDNFIRENRLKIMDYVRQDGVLLEQITNCISELYKKEDINMLTTLTRSVASSISWQKNNETTQNIKGCNFITL